MAGRIGERRKALLAGNATYISGSPCKYGHTSERRVADGKCLACEKIYETARYIRDRDKVLAYRKKRNATKEEKDRIRAYQATTKQRTSKRSKERYAENIEKEHARSHAKYLKNKAAILSYGALWRKNNKDRHKEMCRLWVKNNPDKTLAATNRRRAMQVQALPLWADLEKIDLIYATAKQLEQLDGIKRHVDHEIPLKHDKVCGLHVAENLRIIPAIENIKKSNHYHVF